MESKELTTFRQAMAQMVLEVKSSQEAQERHAFRQLSAQLQRLIPSMPRR
jgi:hypothetical protein